MILTSCFTVTTLVTTQAVVAAEQIECRVEVRVDLMDAIADSFQSHSPVRSLRFLFTARYGSRAYNQDENNMVYREHGVNVAHVVVSAFSFVFSFSR